MPTIKPANANACTFLIIKIRSCITVRNGGLGSQSITQELQKTGVDVSRPTVQRALAKKGVYANRMAVCADLSASGSDSR